MTWTLNSYKKRKRTVKNSGKRTWGRRPVGKHALERDILVKQFLGLKSW